MSKTTKNTLFTIGIALVIVGFFGWRIYTSPERQIKRGFIKMAELASISGQETTLKKAAKTSNLMRYFSLEAVIDWSADNLGGPRSWDGREQIQQTMLTVKNSLMSLEVKIADIAITVQRGKPRAETRFHLTVKTSPAEIFAWQAVAQLEKIWRRWLVTEIKIEPILRPYI